MCLNQLSNAFGWAKIIKHYFTCVGLWAELDVWHLSNAADLTWQFHHKTEKSRQIDAVLLILHPGSFFVKIWAESR